VRNSLFCVSRVQKHARFCFCFGSSFFSGKRQLIITTPRPFFDRRERSKSKNRCARGREGVVVFAKRRAAIAFAFFFVCLREDHPNFESVRVLIICSIR